VGFEDVGAFARSFARHCGETPSAYKRRLSTPLPAAGSQPKVTPWASGSSAE
jgi:AraC-like DNA-binding protein